ncbi:MAG: PAS domain-containing sensor histidine kinase [Cyclobacteriaceae bacterium]
MNLQHWFRNLLVGRGKIESLTEFKSAMMRGYMVLIALLVGITYTVVDMINGISTSLIFYLADVLLALLTLHLNRTRKFLAANLVFLFTFNFLVFLFSSSDLYRTGVYMFFVCISLSAVALLGYERFRYALLFCGLSLLLFILSYWGKFTIMTPLANDETAISIYFTINFLVALVVCVAVVYSLHSINQWADGVINISTRELERSQAQKEMVVEAVQAGIYEWKGGEDSSVYVSDIWKKLLGYRPDELSIITIDFYWSILHPDDTMRVRRVMDEHFRTQKTYLNELRLRTRTGEYRWFLDSGDTRFDDNGKPILTVGSIIDISDRKQVEEKLHTQNQLLLKTNQELDQFVYSVSHDLRAPLSSILGLTRIYELTNEPAERDSIVKLISDRANTLDLFIREILDYSRNARMEVKLKDVHVATLVREIVNGLQHMAGMERIAFQWELDEGIVVRTDPERLKVVVTNLISNAVKYSDTGKNSFVRINSMQEHNTWKFVVADNGIGIEAQHIPKVFEMFYQAHANSQGSGLGLYIVTEAVDRLGGKIQVDSRYAIGTTFTVTLPMDNQAIQD